MTHRFVVDAQLPPRLCVHLRERGHEADHVTELGLGAASDSRIARAAMQRGAILISKDEDFALMAARGTGVRLVWIRLGNVTTRALWAALEPRLSEIEQALAEGERLIEVR